MTHAEAGDEVAPGLADDALADDASEQLRLLMRSRGDREQAALAGIYVAIDPSDTEVTAIGGCDDDGDYVVVLSRALLDLLRHVAHADASDRLRGTRLLHAYGPLLARAQQRDARPLPPPSPRRDPGSLDVRVGEAERELTHAFTDDALAWLVADEVARAVSGELVCPRPTETRESGDAVWTPAEQVAALAGGAARLRDTASAANAAAADAWATRALVERGGSEVPALALLGVMAALEDARPPGVASNYLTLHPGTHDRIDAIQVTAWLAREP